MADPRKTLPGVRSQHPPLDLHARPLPLLELSGSMYRVHQSKYDPIHYGRSKSTRFDHPDGTAGTFGTLYVAEDEFGAFIETCLLYTSPSPRDGLLSRMPSSA